jgi:hypothetical protein
MSHPHPTTAAAARARTFTLGAVARHFSVPEWQIRQALKRGILAEPPRAGLLRFWTEADLPSVEQALRAAGYLRVDVPA